jgi:hypothetical protein
MSCGRSGVLSRADLQLALAFNFNPAGLCLLRNRNPERQHTGVVMGLNVFRVQGVSEDQLAAENSPRPLGHLQLHVGLGGVQAFRPDSKDIPLPFQ